MVTMVRLRLPLEGPSPPAVCWFLKESMALGTAGGGRGPIS